MRTKWGISLDHWTSASQHLKPLVNYCPSRGAVWNLGCKVWHLLDSQTTKETTELSNLLYITLCWEHFYSFLAGHGWAEQYNIGLPLTLQMFSAALLVHCFLPQSLPRRGQHPVKGSQTLGSVCRAVLLTQLLPFAVSHISWIVVVHVLADTCWYPNLHWAAERMQQSCILNKQHPHEAGSFLVPHNRWEPGLLSTCLAVL